MDHGTPAPKIYLKQPSVRQLPTSNERSMSGSSGVSQNRSAPSIALGGLPKVSVYAQAVSAAGSANFGSSGGVKTGVRPTVPSAVSSQTNPGHQAIYNYGPLSTSASIAASATSNRRQNSVPTISYAGYNAIKAGKVPQSIESHKDSDREDNTGAVRQNTPTAPVVYYGGGRGPKIASHATANSDQGKFFQISGLKVKKQFAAGQQQNKVISDGKPVLSLMPSSSSLSNDSSSPHSSGTSSPVSDQLEPYVPVRVPAQFAQPDETDSSRSPSPTDYLSKAPKTFYSSLVGAKGFSLSLTSRQQQSQSMPQLGPLKTPVAPGTFEENDDLGMSSDSDPSDELDVFSNPAPSNPRDLQVKQARSDRKIQDLEISNASLMSVNKYLERKLRSQAKEIQYLKFSSSGPETEITRFDSDVDDSEEENGDNYNLDEDMEDDPNNEALEPTDQTPAEVELANKTKLIEQRMQSHIKFLESSEKVNKMMRNCLVISDTLLQQATKSLEYEVDPSDLKYGLQISTNVYNVNDSGGDSSLNESIEEEEISDTSSLHRTPDHITRPYDTSRSVLEDLIEEDPREDDNETVHGEDEDHVF